MRLSKEAILMSDPEGNLGSFYRKMANLGEIKGDDTNIKKLGKLLFRSVFPIIRVPTNFINMNLDYLPVTGFVKAFEKTTQTRTGRRELSLFERKQRFAAASLGTGIATTLFLTLFEDDKEEEGYQVKLNDDAWIQVTGLGTENYGKNLTITEDWQELSFRIKNPFTGKYMRWFSYKDNPLGMVLFPFGVASDKLRYKDFQKRSKGEEPQPDDSSMMGRIITNAFWVPLVFASSQSYQQGLRTFMGLIPSRENLSNMAGVERNTSKLLTSPVRSVAMPNFYNEMYKQYKIASRIPEKYTHDPWKKALKGVPLFESILRDHDYDLFGYKIEKKVGIPLVPDILMEQFVENFDRRVDRKAWRLLFKYDEVVLAPFYPPKKVEGIVVDKVLSSQYLKVAGKELRDQVNEYYKDLDKLPPEELQRELNAMKRIAAREARYKVYGEE
jgi:hypothetical protein